MFYKVQFFKQVELSRRGLFFKLWGTQASTLECWAGVSLQIGGGGWPSSHLHPLGPAHAISSGARAGAGQKL